VWQALSANRKRLLPALHLVWDALAARLRDSEVVVVMTTLRSFAAIVSLDADFLQARTERCVSLHEIAIVA
jgi:hypothetical protein